MKPQLQQKWDLFGALPFSVFAAPWAEEVGTSEEGEVLVGPEYLPRSARSGRHVAYSVAMEDYMSHHGAVGSSGLWDHEIDPGHERQMRYDQALVCTSVAMHRHEYSPREHDVVEMYWHRLASEKVAACYLGLGERHVHQLIGRVRDKAAVLPTPLTAHRYPTYSAPPI